MSLNDSSFGARSRRPLLPHEPLSPHLRLVEVDFLKPASRNDGARNLDKEAAKTAAQLLAGMGDGGWE